MGKNAPPVKVETVGDEQLFRVTRPTSSNNPAIWKMNTKREINGELFIIATSIKTGVTRKFYGTLLVFPILEAETSNSSNIATIEASRPQHRGPLDPEK